MINRKIIKNSLIKSFSITFCFLISLNLNTSISQTLDFPHFDSLPDTKGWTYLTNTSNEIYSIKDSLLIQNSIGNSNAYGFYQLDYGTVIIPEAYWTVKVKARVIEIEEPNSGFFFNVVQNDLLYSVRITPYSIYLADSNNDQYVIIENDNTIFHDYELKGSPNSRMELLIDDSLITTEASPIDISTLDFNTGYDLAFGDGTSRNSVNAHGEWASYKFSQYTINPYITKIEDIPNDQGGWVKIYFTKSFYDTDSLILSKSTSIEVYTVEVEDSMGWTAVANTIAYGKSIYSVLVPTTKDSTNEHTGLLNFRIVAGMEEGNYLSNVKAGYSTDNISPATPNNFIGSLTTDTKINLSWSNSLEKDFQYYIIFRSIDNQNFELISESIDTFYIDSNVEMSANYYYSIAAVDYSGNKSNLSQVIAITITNINGQDNLPNEYILGQNYPNPFNPSTKINYSVPQKSFVTLKIYDSIGNEIITLVNKEKLKGNYNIIFNGNELSSGIYFANFKANNFSKSIKMLLIK